MSGTLITAIVIIIAFYYLMIRLIHLFFPKPRQQQFAEYEGANHKSLDEETESKFFTFTELDLNTVRELYEK